ncbi:MAG: hypothetical protein AB7U59_08230 [Desulfovibrionaceae bacterium]|jgi:hypothetical protein
MRLFGLAVVLSLGLVALAGCVRHTYYVELTNGQYFYVDPPLILDREAQVYSMRVNGVRKVIAMDEVSHIDDAAQICYQNLQTDTFTCIDGLYQY